MSDTDNRPSSVMAVARSGKVLVMLAIMIPCLFGIVGLVIDGGLMMSSVRNLQHAADAAATAAAMDVRLRKGAAAAAATATDIVQAGNQLPSTEVTVNIPPTSGEYAGRSGFVEVVVDDTYQSRFIRILDSITDRPIRARAVAGVDDVTEGVAIVVLDPEPGELTYPSVGELAGTIDDEIIADDAAAQSGATDLLSSVPLVGSVATNLVNTQLSNVLPDQVNGALDSVISTVPTTSIPTITAGMEVEGLGRLIVDGAVLVNNEWGGVDENGDKVGEADGPPYGLACMPLLPTTRLRARDVRVVGGVDNQDHYEPFDGGDTSPLQANRLPVPDPFADLPVPSTSSDSTNVNATVHDPPDLVKVVLSADAAAQLADDVLSQLSPLLRPMFEPLVDPLIDLLSETTIEPGVYNSITVIAPVGGATFEPGVYIVRGTNPNTDLSLCVLGPVVADGVLFYVTNSAGFDPSTGTPDASEDSTTSPPNPLLSLSASVLIAPLLPGARYSGLNDAGSSFDGMLIYQHRTDRRLIVIEAQQLVGSGDVSGTIYSKWGHVLFVAGAGSYDLRFVTGTMRVLTVTNTTLAPSNLLPAAQDVLLVE